MTFREDFAELFVIAGQSAIDLGELVRVDGFVMAPDTWMIEREANGLPLPPHTHRAEGEAPDGRACVLFMGVPEGWEE